MTRNLRRFFSAMIVVQKDQTTQRNEVCSSSPMAERYSLRKSDRINLSVLDDKELEAVLFGYDRGAEGSNYTTKRGLFELANGGTVLVEEIRSDKPFCSR